MLPNSRDNFKLQAGKISVELAPDTLTWVHIGARKAESKDWLEE